MPDPAYGQTDVMHDPNYLRAMLAHNNPRIRAQAEAALQQLQAQEVHQQQLHEFQQRERDRNLAHEENLGLRESESANRNTQRDMQREGITADREAKGEDRRSAMLHTILSDPTANPAIKEAIQNHLLKQAGVQATLPVDPKVAALARSKGLPEPTPQTIGGGAPIETNLTRTTTPVDNRPYVSPQEANRLQGSPDQMEHAFAMKRMLETGQARGDERTGYPELPNTPEQRFVGLGHDPLEGSRVVQQSGQYGLATPSGGFAGGLPTSERGMEHLAGRIAPRELVSPSGPAMTANQGSEPAFRGHGAGSSWEGPTSPSQLAGQPQVAAPQAPTEAPKQWGSGAMASGTGSGAWLADQFKSLPITFNPGMSNQAQDAAKSTVAAAAPPPVTLPPTKRLTPEEERMRQLANQ